MKARPAHRTPLSRKAWEREGPTPRAWEGEGFRINHNDTTDTTLDQRSATRATVAACTEGGCGLRAQGTHTLPAGAGLHTVYVDSCTNTGPARDYVLRVTLGTCASPSVLCGNNRCANRTSDSQNCGSCGNVCTGCRS